MPHDASTFAPTRVSSRTPAQTKAVEDAQNAASKAKFAAARTVWRSAFRRLSGYPEAASLAPSTAAGAATGTVAVTVTGTNFDASSVVEVNGVPVTTSYTNPTTLVATVPKVVGPTTRTITVSASGGRKSSGLTFTWT